MVSKNGWPWGFLAEDLKFKLSWVPTWPKDIVYYFPKIVGFGKGSSFEFEFAKWFQGISGLSKNKKKNGYC